MVQIQNEGYFYDANLPAELHRLRVQAAFLTSVIGLFPREMHATDEIHDVLDLACGTGEWVINMVKHSGKKAWGIDNSKQMLDYCQAQKISELGPIGQEAMAHFQYGDLLQPLPFSSNSFDYINGRLIFGALTVETWLPLLQECLRLLRPGGYIRITESDVVASTNKPTLAEYGMIIAQALYNTHKFYTPYSRGIYPYIPQLMGEAGFTQILKENFLIDEAEQQNYKPIKQGYEEIFKNFNPYLVRTGAVTEEKLKELIPQVRQELNSPDYQSYGIISSVIARKL